MVDMTAATIATNKIPPRKIPALEEIISEKRGPSSFWEKNTGREIIPMKTTIP
jgi:hypothetical protein